VPSRLTVKTRSLVVLVVVSNVAGNCLLSVGMRAMGEISSFSPWPYLRALVSPLVVAAIAILVVSMVSQLLLMSWADLSYVIPMTSAAYVLTALVGMVFLHEQVPLPHWAGVALITVGVGLVSRTAPG
jgi:drug/metabolite transporter (DMT)-like permease